MDFDRLTTREVPLDLKRSALLFIDVQNFSVRRDGGEFRDVSDAEISDLTFVVALMNAFNRLAVGMKL